MSIKIKGLVKLLKELENLESESSKRIAGTTEANAREIALDAKKLAPVDLGTLRQSIKEFELNPLNWKILANSTGLAPYAAYMEFGTGGLVEVPEELKEVAIQFKGKGVKQINLRPRPYLYPAYIKGRKQYIKDLEKDLDYLTENI